LLGHLDAGGDVWAAWTPAPQMARRWRQLRDAYPNTGLWPLVLGDPGDMYRGLPALGMAYCAEEELAAADDTDGALTLASFPDETDDPVDLDIREPTELLPAPAWTFHSWQQSGWIGLIPTTDPTDVAARLGWDGGCNFDISPHQHVAVLRHWAKAFGAEVIAMTGEQVMELAVAHPPSTPGECLRVALEQYRYCPDIVDQGVGSIHDLAATQVPSSSWYFWWD
jgi:hypothetical protein